MNYTIENGILNVTVSSKGGEMQSIKTKDGTEYLWQGSQETWSDKAPNIFPYVGRLTNKTYTFQGKEYHMEIHGFLPYEEMDCVIYEKNKVIFRLRDNDRLNQSYPFHFEYILGYKLEKNKICVTIEIHNLDEKTMYFGLGGHPGFNVPLEEGLKFEDYCLEFSKDCEPLQITFSETCFVTDKNKPYSLVNERKIPLKHDLFDEDAIVFHNVAKEVSLKSEKGKKAVKVTFPQMDYIGFWHWPKSIVQYVCIEPWSSLPAREGVIEDFEKQENMLSLGVSETYTNTWFIEIVE